MALTAEQRRGLLALARGALHARVRQQPPPDVPPELNTPAFGAFVTAHHQGELRGCLGTLEAREPLGQVVVRLAGDVAQHDYRFEPIRPDELDDVTLDISVLTPPERVTDASTIEVGRDGLIISLSGRRGLLLPQVAGEHGWDRETFLAHTCLKAGLPPEAWRHGARIERFQAEVFREEDYAD
jgi:AmmeMemoRadiSam system protein A